jgi:beta-lactamase regulating signal transducer with metallopeptidase domain
MHLRCPKVTISDKPYILPCLVGVFKPTIILSPTIAEESSDDVLEAILAHELAHLKRRDNLLHWISVVVRDLLFANPFTYWVFPKMMIAKEQDCDRIAANATGKPKAVAEAILYAATATGVKTIKPLPGYLSGVSESISTGKLISRRVDMLLQWSPASKLKIHWLKGSIVIILSLLCFFIQLYVAAPYPILSPVIQF